MLVYSGQFISVTQSCPTLCRTAWTAARQASLPIINSWSLLKLVSMMSRWCHHLMPCHPLLPAFDLSQHEVKEWSEAAQLCLTLCDPVDCSPPGSSVHGILQARILEWVAISFSRESSRFSHVAGRHFNLWATRKAWGSFQMSQFFTSGGQSIGVSASASVLPMNIQDWFPLG